MRMKCWHLYLTYGATLSCITVED